MTKPFAALQELGDTTRLRVFLALLGARKNVSQIVAELELAQPQVSYHLKKLKDAGLAVEEKDGRWVWYQADWQSGDPRMREFIDLMARWAGGAGRSDAGSEQPEPVTVRPATAAQRARGAGVMSSGRGGRGRGRKRPVVRVDADEPPVFKRPAKDDEMDDFLL